MGKSSEKWEDKRCMYSAKADQDGKLLIKGRFSNGIAVAKFSLREQKNGEYRIRGRLSMRSVRTGHVLKWTDKSGNAHQISADIRLKDMEEETVKAAIENQFNRLVAKHYAIIYKDLKNKRTDDMTLSQALNIYGREFVVSRKRLKRGVLPEEGKDPYDRILREMNKTAVEVEKYALNDIPQSTLVRVKRECGYATDRVYSLLCEFTSYLQMTHRCSGENVFLKYYEHNPRKTPKSAEMLIKNLERYKSLESRVEKELVAKIRQAPADDEKITGLLLIYGAGFSAPEVCELKWSDLIFGKLRSPDSCQIKLWKDKTTGATHDFTRPLFYYVSRELKRRHDELKVQDDALDEKRILSHTTASELTAYCRVTLLHAGMAYGEVKEAKTKTIGGGVMLLRQNYCYKLRYECGIRNEAELNYMQMRSMANDVTLDHYCSKSSPTGQERLQTALNRYTAFEEAPRNIGITVEDKGENGLRRVTIPPSDPARVTAVTFRMKMKPGEVLRIFSHEGLKGTVVVNPGKA